MDQYKARGRGAQPQIILVGGLRTVELGFENQAFGVHEQMTLRIPAPSYPPPVVTALFSAYTGCLCGLGVHTIPALLGWAFLPKRVLAGARAALRLTARRCPPYAIC